VYLTERGLEYRGPGVHVREDSTAVTSGSVAAARAADARDLSRMTEEQICARAETVAAMVEWMRGSEQ
jgi:hypothetical protein